MQPPLPEAMMKVLKNGLFSYLGIAERGGPSVMPTAFAFDAADNVLYLAPLMDSAAFENVQENSPACLTVDVRDAFNPFNNEGVMIQGTASSIQMETARSIFPLVVHKYRSFIQLEPANSQHVNLAGSLVKLTPSRIVYWKGARFMRWLPASNERRQPAHQS